MKNNRHYHVISHTHWDREWYEPLEVFRVRLVRLIDNLLELVEKEPDFVFHLDAQTIVLKDYLEIKPANRNRLENAIRRHQILIGPWYVQNDLYQTCGESTVRNLLTGMAMVRQFGGSPKLVGYAPDHFGNISQLPQILRGFGLKHLIFGRGRVCNEENGKKAEFIWEGFDGSRVLAVQMVGFYNNAQRFSANQERAWGFFRQAVDKLSPVNATGQYLLMNGVDHLEAQEDLLAVLPGIAARLPQNESISQSTLYDFACAAEKDLKNPEIHHGELRSGGERILCVGTISSRIAMKQRNTASENKLFGQMEVFASMLLALGFPVREYDREFLDYLWKLLVENQPHDSICGCSQDAVHRHMLDRFERFDETANHILSEKFRLLGSHIDHRGSRDDYYILAVNSLPWPRAGAIEATLDLTVSEKIRHFALYDAQGRELSYSILSKIRTERALRSPINLPGRILVDRYRIRFNASLPAAGYEVFTIRSNGKPEVKPALGFANKHLSVTIGEDGRIDVINRHNGVKFTDIFDLEDTADFGDSYTYRPDASTGRILASEFAPRIRLLHDNSQESVCELLYTMRVPARADRVKRKRSRKLVAMPLRVTLCLSAESDKLKISIDGCNPADDHCLRALFKSGIKGDVTESSGVFEIARRDRMALAAESRNDCEEPFRDFVRLYDRKKGSFCVLSRGLHSYEHYRGRAGEIGIALFRGNGYIMGYFETPLDASWLVPENQCRGEFHAELALRFDAQDNLTHDARAAREFNVPVLTFSDSFDPKKFSGGRPCIQDSELSEIFVRPDPYAGIHLPEEQSLLELDHPAIQMSAWKLSLDGEGMILRFYNPLEIPAVCRITFGFSVRSIGRVSLAEEDETSLVPEGNTLNLSFGAGEIITLKVVPLHVKDK